MKSMSAGAKANYTAAKSGKPFRPNNASGYGGMSIAPKPSKKLKGIKNLPRTLSALSSMPAAFGKSLIGQDSFTKQVAKQAKRK